MLGKGNWMIWLIIIPTVCRSTVVSYNQPKFAPCASWNPNATTFANRSQISYYTNGMFINTNNTIFIAARSLYQVQVWREGSPNPSRIISGGLNFTHNVFVTTNDDVYVDDGFYNNQVKKWPLNATDGIVVMDGTSPCYGLFVDINNTLYCSEISFNRVIKKSMSNASSITTTVAGNGSSGSTSNQLNEPYGIFVTINFSLYVADYGNNRIQLFRRGELNATTVAGNGSTETITLNCPTGIVLDADNYLFITDFNNNRIVGSGRNGFRCLVGCFGSRGSEVYQLDHPRTTVFDIYGNMFVVDHYNHRIQKFFLARNTCDETTITTRMTGVTTSIMKTTVRQTTTSMTDATTSIMKTTVSQTTTSMADATTSITETIAALTTMKALEKQPTSIRQQPSIHTPLMSITSSTTSTAETSCFPPVINLAPASPAILFPLQFRQSQNVYINSYLQLNCTASLSTITTWTVKNCTSSGSFQVQFGPQIVPTRNELFIPRKTLSYGVYELQLTVTMTVSPNFISSAFTYIKINPSDVTANLVPLGTSMITHGYRQNLILNPGRYSVDPDANIFNKTDWNYKYYCRIYRLYEFPNINGTPLSIDDPRIDSANPPCFSNQSSNRTAWKYSGPTSSPKSSLVILSGSLSVNQTYQIMVIMANRQKPSVQATGYLLVQVDDTSPPMIVLACVISTMCISNVEYQSVNPTTQVALYSVCIGNCTTTSNLTWNIYQGSINLTSNIVQWTLFNKLNTYRDIWFFGTNTTNFTAINKLFISNPHVVYWRFQVVYSFPLESSSSALNFIINQPPQNGSCSIIPNNGTTTTLFTISCLNWVDQNGIKDYLFYGWTTNPADRVMLAFSFTSPIQLLLPATNDNTSLLNIIAYIRDTYDCVAELNMSSVLVQPNLAQIDNLIDHLHNSTDNSFAQMLATGDQNIISQVITSVSQQFNQINNKAVETAIASGVAPATIAVSPLGSKASRVSSGPLNTSALAQYNKQLNTYANVRDSLIKYTTDLTITTAESIKLQASSLAQLTQATNQLTRNTLMLASDKCYELALNLRSMATTISYDDVQIAARYITQAANNILTAVNSPLQERTTILDLDWSRANTLPADYDTDLESEWSNPNLFADKNDFSWTTVQKGRNKYHQKQLADKVNSQLTEIIVLITSALNIHLNIGQNLTVDSPSVFVLVETTSVVSLSNRVIQQVGDAQIRIPSSFTLSTDDNTSISLRSMMLPLAVADESEVQSNTNLSTSISLTIVDRNGNAVPLQTSVDQRIELIIPRDPNMIIPPMSFQNVTPTSAIRHHQLFNLHYVKLPRAQWNNNRTVALIIEMHPLDPNVGYFFIYRFDYSPQLNSSINQTDGWSIFCPGNLSTGDIFTYFLDNEQTSDHQSIIFGLRELNSTELDNYCSNQSMKNVPPISNEPFNFTSNYELRTYTACCYYLDQNNIWQTNGLIVGPKTNHGQTQCFSTHLTTFAGGFLVLPSPINWNYVFSNADFNQNKTIYLTVICLSVLYLLLVIYARYKDKKDVEKLGVTALPDNYSADRYFYEIVVFTGHRKNAGTQSKVQFVVTGDKNETSVRTFADPHRKVLQRGGIHAFVMAVPKSLGSLKYIRIWHDNSGSGASASWFLKYLIIRDLQTLEKSYFISQQWFAVENGDGRIERVLPVADEMQKQEFSFVLSKQAYHSISEGHLWFSIFSRPPSNTFTRVQRCTCCFVLLFTSMLLNILYYDQVKESKVTNESLSFGPFYLTPEQIGIGVIVEILAFLPSILLVQLFRRTSPRRLFSPLHQTLHQMQSRSISGKEIELKKKKNGGKFMFPWWFLFVDHGLSLILFVISTFFIIARGIEFGDLKSQKWLTSLISGFFSSILLIQPLKILGLAIFFAFFIRKTNEDKEGAEFLEDDRFDLSNDEEYLQAVKESPFATRCRSRVDRLNDGEIVWARRERRKEIKMWSVIRELFSYCSFLALIYFLTYSNQNSNFFLQVQHLRKFFLNSRQIDSDFTKISTVNEYWNWLENSFVSNIRAQQWYNAELPRNLTGYVNDKNNRLIGWGTMRQLRVRAESCRTKISPICKFDYNVFNEEKSSFERGWTNETTVMFNSSIDRSFVYRKGAEIDGNLIVGKHATYHSGGYLYEYRGRLSDLRSNLSELHRLNWIDSQTRAVIIQLSLYNPNIQLFTSVTFLMEFLSTGGLAPLSRFEPVSFQVFTSTSQLVCTILYLLLIVYQMIVEIKHVVRMKCSYFLQFWSYIDIGIIGCSWGMVGVYLWRYKESVRIGHLFEATNGYVYINLQTIVYLHDTLTFLLGFCCFFGTIKFLRLCRFHRRLALFTETLRYAKKDLISFFVTFCCVFMAFLSLFYLLFIEHLWSCSTLLQTAQMLFEMILMKFDANQIQNAAPVLGPLCFSLFILLVVFVCMSMFITIINDSFRLARENCKVNRNEDYEAFGYLLRRFRRWIGLNQMELEEEREERMRATYYDPIENFPDKVDQLLEALNRIYMSQQIENDRICLYKT